MRTSTIWVLLFGVVLAAGRAPSTAAPSRSVTEPRLTLARGAGIAAAVAALGAAAPGVVVADASPLRPLLKEPLADVPLPDALQRISSGLDRYVVRRGRVLALQRRFSDPDEEPALELDALRQVTAQLERLIRPYALGPLDARYIYRKQEFNQSLTSEQQQAMLGKGLPIADLPEQQRALLLQINQAHAYTSEGHELRRAALWLAGWKNSTLNARDHLGFRLHSIIIWFPDPEADRGGRDALQMAAPGPNRYPAPGGPGGEELPAPKPLAGPASLRARWEMAPRATNVRTLLRELREAEGPPVEAPAYAGERKVHVVSRGGTRAEVLAALADLYGWELLPASKGYALRPPEAAPARDALDLHHKMRRAVVPSLRHQLAAGWGGATDRHQRQLELVFPSAEKVGGKDWQQVTLTELDEAAQVRLANVVTVGTLGQWYGTHGRSERPPAWVLNPERGFLQLNRLIAPGSRSTIRFAVPTEDGRSIGWSWGVGPPQVFK